MASQKKVTVNGVEYTLQHPGAMWYIEMTDRARNQFGVRQTASYYEELFKNVVVSPQISVEDFEEDISSVYTLGREIEIFLASAGNASTSKTSSQG